jgi:hypothetical protein
MEPCAGMTARLFDFELSVNSIPGNKNASRIIVHEAFCSGSVSIRG